MQSFSSVHEQVAAQAALTPSRVAVIHPDGAITYRELWDRTSDISRSLRGMGVGRGVCVGVCLDRGVDLVAGLLAVLRAGAAYIPIDPGFPSDRIAYMLQHSRAKVVLTQAEIAARLPLRDAAVLLLDRELPAEPVHAAELPDLNAVDLAYVIYTSGSTGKPKGVEIGHGALTNLLASMRERPGITPEDVLHAVTTVSFDIAALELFLPLTVGARVVIATQDVALDPHRLIQSMKAHGATILQATPVTWRMLVEAGWDGQPQLRALSGGEALPRDLATKLLGLGVELWNLYGPTETTIWSTVARVLSPDDAAFIGHPIHNTPLYILDAALQRVLSGSPGELCIGGAGLARGYHDAPRLTEERFIEFPPGSGERVYRTGDLVREAPDGRIEYLGRQDNQVKIRGYRIELGEIEARILEAPGVRQAVVVAREDAPGDKRLVAYFAVIEEEACSVEVLAAHLRTHLPRYMIPSAWVRLDEFPLTPNRKIDRNALPTPEWEHEPSGLPPSGPVEQALATLICEALGISRVGRNDGFFELGGDSLQAVRLRMRIEEHFGVRIGVRAIFEHPSVAALAGVIEGELADGSGADEPCAHGEFIPEQEFPLSRSQRRAWFLAQINVAPGVLNVHDAWRVRGALDEDAFAAAFANTIFDHDALSMVFSTDSAGRPIQRRTGFVPVLERIDLEGVPPAERDARAMVCATGRATEPFDLRRGPPWRALLVRLTPEDHLFVLVVHHIVFDEDSAEIIRRDLESAYTARLRGGAPRERVSASRYAGQMVADDARPFPEADRAFWRCYLSGAPSSVELPTDLPRPSCRKFSGSAVWCVLPEPLVNRMRALARRESATLYHLCLTAWSVVLARHSGQEDMVIGTPTSTRTRAGLGDIVGFFVNLLPVRVRIPPDSTLDGLLASTRDAAVAALAHGDVDFEQIVRECSTNRGASLSPLLNHALSYLRGDDGGAFAGLARVPVTLDTAFSQYDQFLWLTETASGLSARLDFDTDLFSRARAERMLEHFQCVLGLLVSEPATPAWGFPLLSARDHREIEGRWDSARRTASGPETVVGMFKLRAASAPDATAVIYGGETHSYARLDRRSADLSVALKARGIRAGQRVVLFVDRSPEMVIALLAILRAGGAYVPMDPAYPADRVSYVIKDSSAALVLTQRDLAALLPPDAGPLMLLEEIESLPSGIAPQEPAEPDPASTAYVLYTSGSTGNPKGVEVPHGALANFLHAMARRPGLAPDDRVLALTTIAFDIAGLEIYLPLSVGASIVLVSRRLAVDGIALQREILRTGVTVVQATPATFRLLLAAGWTGSPGLRTLCGGEALPAELAARLTAVCAELWNMYGPTETTIWSTCALVDDPDDISIGHPIDNTDVLVVDSRGNVQPAGLEGELLIGGKGVANGYLGRLELTAEKFVAHPLRPGERAYRTGDRGLWRLDGNLSCLGRIDQQIKLRGYRIEPGEIEARLAQHPAIRESVVVLADDGVGDKCLAAYIVARDARLLDLSALRAHLRQRLPDYMVPTAWVAMESLPLTPNGKIDRRALPPAARADKETIGMKGLDVHTRLAAIFQQVLGVPVESLDDDFFALGGHSLSVLSLVSQVNEAFRTSLEPVVLFERPTVNLLAKLLGNVPNDGDAVPVAAPSSPESQSRVEEILGAVGCGVGTGGGLHAPMRENWLCRMVFAPAYGLQRASVRRFLTRVILKLEGGAIFSVTLRKLYAKHHDIVIGDYTGVDFSPLRLKEKTRIGRYCSIYPTVTFQNAEHPRNTISTHGIFYHRALGFSDGYELERAQIEVGHDVWIGDDAKILYPTRRIGTGAIIAANAVVVEDVPPYAIVGGYPARVLRYRFSRDTIEKLLRSEWWEKSPSELYAVRDQFLLPLEGEKIR
jgi:amino acid adenylation domain-containing protein